MRNNKLEWNFHWYTIFFEENEFEYIVCKILAILCGLPSVNTCPCCHGYKEIVQIHVPSGLVFQAEYKHVVHQESSYMSSIFQGSSTWLPLQWRHDVHDGISNHWCLDCLLNRLFRCRSKKTSKLCITGLCERNSPMTNEFLSQRASNAESVSVWWCHHDTCGCQVLPVTKPCRCMTGYTLYLHDSLVGLYDGAKFCRL